MRSLRLLAAATAILVLGSACSSKGGNITPPPDNTPPVASFTFVCQTFSCTFTDASTDADGTIASWSWAFGDGSTSTEQSPSHPYAGTDPASYQVTLTVTDNEGATNPTTKTVNVGPAATLECPNGTDCTIDLVSKAIVTVTKTSALGDCQLIGNAFAIIQPIQQTLFTDGCFVPAGTVYTLNGPNADKSFNGATSIQAQFTQGHAGPSAPPLGSPQLRLVGTFPDWTIQFDDGGDPTGVGEPDFNDIVLAVHAQIVP
jgi:PKD repeat protein